MFSLNKNIYAYLPQRSSRDHSKCYQSNYFTGIFKQYLSALCLVIKGYAFQSCFYCTVISSLISRGPWSFRVLIQGKIKPNLLEMYYNIFNLDNNITQSSSVARDLCDIHHWVAQFMIWFHTNSRTNSEVPNSMIWAQPQQRYNVAYFRD